MLSCGSGWPTRALEDHVFTTPPARQNAWGAPGVSVNARRPLWLGHGPVALTRRFFLLFGTCLSGCVTEETRETGRENGGTGRDREGDRGRRARIKGRSLSPLSHPPASPQMRGSPRSHACHTCHPHRTMVLARG